ncbi:MAG: exodeoxyribonuclease VII large subunit [Alteromonadaceae bacterium]|nr:exodeoxyribonuclease VII large subunit [Alteromonadaceae bacterium]
MSLSEKRSNIFTVSRLNRFAKHILSSEIGEIWLNAEISNFVAASSGHWYFTLKDSNAQIKAAMFRNANQRLRMRPKAGDNVLIRGAVSLYEARGDYQLIAEHMEPAGAGLLKQQFDELKYKLAQEGLFAQEHKLPIPKNPRKLGIVTSATGAALQDVLSVLARRSPGIEIIVYPSQVQGDTAAQQLVEALTKATQRNEVDVILLTRGGGSMEDLWCFNDEQLARTIFSCPIPLISAVGHEIDFTIADFVADLRSPTPSAAAEIVSYDLLELQQQILHLKKRLLSNWQQQITIQSTKLSNTVYRLKSVHPSQQINQKSQHIDQLSMRLNTAMNTLLKNKMTRMVFQENRLHSHSPNKRIERYDYILSGLEQRLKRKLQSVLQDKQTKFANTCEMLNALSPLSTLSRGYSISFKNGQVLTSKAAVSSGDIVKTRLHDGEFESKVL